jgi:phage terminase large subunit-like protein
LDILSVLAGGRVRGGELAKQVYPRVLDAVPQKMLWFAQKGYVPHTYQAAFHGAQNKGQLTRFRHLVAGRRGGKTLSAAWEVLFYALHPAQFHRDVHGEDSSRALMVWMLAKDYPTGKPSIDTFLEVIRQVGLTKGRDFQYNKTERRFEFYESGSVVQFRTAEDPQSLRGAGLDILWMDEAAFIPNADAYTVSSPALADRRGLVITTTTPFGKNWLYEEFFTGAALKDRNEFRVQYTSIDNPYFSREEWERYKRRYHPIFFKQEFMASFDAFAGVALQGDWLKYWVSGKVEPHTSDISVRHLKTPEGQYRLDIFLGIDPAVSLADTADHFAMAVIGLTDDRTQAFLLDTFLGRVPFPDQVNLIREWQLKWRPQLIGVESNAFQVALAQQSLRLDGFPGIVPVIAKGKKNERILSMSPLFKIGRIRVNRRHGEFIDQWVSFDPDKKNQKDDLLDAVEIALGVAGVILPAMPHESFVDGFTRTDHADVQALVKQQIRAMMDNTIQPVDEEMGEDW